MVESSGLRLEDLGLIMENQLQKTRNIEWPPG